MAGALVDTEILGKNLSVWNGEKKKYKRWSKKMLGYIGALSRPLADACRRIASAEWVNEDVRMEGLPDDQRDLAAQLWYILQAFVDGDADDIMENCDMEIFDQDAANEDVIYASAEAIAVSPSMPNVTM